VRQQQPLWQSPQPLAPRDVCFSSSRKCECNAVVCISPSACSLLPTFKRYLAQCDDVQSCICMQRFKPDTMLMHVALSQCFCFLHMAYTDWAHTFLRLFLPFVYNPATANFRSHAIHVFLLGTCLQVAKPPPMP